MINELRVRVAALEAENVRLPVPVEDLPPGPQIRLILLGAFEVEMVAGRRDLQPVVAPSGREPRDLLERPISAETLRKRLRLGAVKSRVWCHAIRAGDRDAVCGTDRA